LTDVSTELLTRSLESDRIHSAYLISGPPELGRAVALSFARAAVCEGSEKPCDACPACHKSGERELIELDGTGKKGPMLRHVGDHADLLWVERGPDDTRVRIGQVRALQQALRVRSTEGGRRIAVVADAEWLNQEAQNALLRLLEEPPPATTIVLVAATSAGMLATVRSRCQRIALRPPAEDPLADEDNAQLVARLDDIGRADVPDLLDWAEDYRGARAEAAERTLQLIDVGSCWLRRRIEKRLAQDAVGSVRRSLEACSALSRCRKTLVQRNANPQMVAEKALFALQQAVS
jgi:DNA polymerase-3 subunit delta'